MALIDVLNSEMGIGLGLGLSNLVPPAVGYPFSRLIADGLASLRTTPIVKAVRSNQWLIHNGQISAQQLNHLVRETFRSSARSLYEFWHLFRSPQAILDMVEFEPSFINMFNRALRRTSGTILVSAHQSNFDLIGRAITLRGLEMQILSYPKPPGGYRWQNQIREMPGYRVTPMSVEALRQASETLRANQVVLTSIDRPLPVATLPAGGAKYRPRFFGRAANMPVYYIRLALKHNLPITVLGAMRKADGKYRVWASEPISLQHAADLVRETDQNAEKILSVLAGYILQAPEQWAMFYPIWPELQDSVGK